METKLPSCAEIVFLWGGVLVFGVPSTQVVQYGSALWLLKANPFKFKWKKDAFDERYQSGFLVCLRVTASFPNGLGSVFFRFHLSQPELWYRFLGANLKRGRNAPNKDSGTKKHLTLLSRGYGINLERSYFEPKHARISVNQSENEPTAT